MKKLLALSLAIGSFAAMAESISFTHWGNTGGRQSYYACDYAEYQTETFLKVVGAQDIEVSCTGGIQSWGSLQPVSITAEFTVPTASTVARVETVEVEGDFTNPACGLNVQIINTILKKFPLVKVVKKSDACAFANSNYYYLLNITR